MVFLKKIFFGVFQGTLFRSYHYRVYDRIDYNLSYHKVQNICHLIDQNTVHISDIFSCLSASIERKFQCKIVNKVKYEQN